MSVSRVFLAVVLTVAEASAQFESGAVIRSDGDQFYRNTIPQVATLNDGRLFTVWSAVGKTDTLGKVYGAFSTDSGKTWSAPRLLMADPDQFMADPNILVEGKRVFVFSTKVNRPNRIDKSWTMLIRSEDNGTTWSPLSELVIPRQYVAGKQHNGIVLQNGTYMLGVAWDKWPEMGMAARTEGEMNLTAGVLLSRDGKRWTLHGALHTFVEKALPGSTNGLCEPALVELDNGEVLMILRSGATQHYESRSRDGGVTWSEPVPSALPGHNTPTALLRLRGGSNEIVAVWNNYPLVRDPLSVALSADGGKTWSPARIVAKSNGLGVSYPGVTQAPDGSLVAVWQQTLADGGRDIRWARFSREWVLSGN